MGSLKCFQEMLDHDDDGDDFLEPKETSGGFPVFQPQENSSDAILFAWVSFQLYSCSWNFAVVGCEQYSGQPNQ